MKTQFTKATGHGNHWECLGKPTEELIKKFIPLTIAKGQVGSEAARPNGRLPLVSIIHAPQPLGAMVVLEVDRLQKRSSLVTGFPYAQPVGRHSLKLDEIRDWGNETEAVLVCTSDKAEVAFFDTQYYAHQDRYVTGKSYDFALTGLIYMARCTNDESFQTTDQVVLKKIYAAWGEEPERLPDGTIPPITHTLAGCTGLAGRSEDYPEDAEFYCVIKAVSEFNLEGIHIYQITPEPGEAGLPMPGTIFGAAAAFKDGYIPKVGDSIGGGLWLQGCLVPNCEGNWRGT
jgi:hypothetical protein